MVGGSCLAEVAAKEQAKSDVVAKLSSCLNGTGFILTNSMFGEARVVCVTKATSNAESTGFVPVFSKQICKKLTQVPNFECQSSVALGDVFVHGSGECDQLGLGDKVRERKKPTLVKSLTGIRVCNLASGAMHVACVTCDGRLFTWGVGDDFALGRPVGEMDCEPQQVSFPQETRIKTVSCGDCHTCALDSQRHVWLWGTYKDSNGYIGFPGPGGVVLEKMAEPTIVLERATMIASGAHHTLAVAEIPFEKKQRTKLNAPTFEKRVCCWGSNATGQLGLPGSPACGVQEEFVQAHLLRDRMQSFRYEGSSCFVCGGKVDGLCTDEQKVLRIEYADGGDVVDGEGLTTADFSKALKSDAFIVLMKPDRKVEQAEKQKLLWPQENHGVTALKGSICGVFASADCSFFSSIRGDVLGCGLNGDYQVGAGFASLAVPTMRFVLGIQHVIKICGGTHCSAALRRDGKIFTWGRAEECGHGRVPGERCIKFPRQLPHVENIRSLRCGSHHMLACSGTGDLYTWGCGLSYQLGNVPRDFNNPMDVDMEPCDEEQPYLMSSKQLSDRFVLLADGGAQHSVELAWDGSYGQELSFASESKAPKEAVSAKKKPSCVGTKAIKREASVRKILKRPALNALSKKS
eukprot:gnl/MRDRNA2_/MRDRNA2_145462_c0_seq1.p1 gnl/MRDRNA2_/MRDRNA2_145462_c0~~gnl/MRDRNA2_/MRDRNA2_145462_c0_seq1.p1  ORF type:complete len:633 (-),score=120.29 gnl/MRDRNA2_/MRDRNA2_145462_c0_seq1:17-1915(-)